jgi:large subunit ribosomal protein L7/L12
VAKMSSTDLMDAFREMTVLELAEFVKDFESTFGVTAAVSVNGTPPAVNDTPAGEEDEQTEFDVVLTSAGSKKIQVIKEVRVLTRLGLKEAKDLVEHTPATVLEHVDRATADKAADLLEAAGAAFDVR